MLHFVIGQGPCQAHEAARVCASGSAVAYRESCRCHVVWLLPLFALALLRLPSRRKLAISGMEGMPGATAEGVTPRRPRGTGRYHSTFWYARAREPIVVGETVRIGGNEGRCLGGRR